MLTLFPQAQLPAFDVVSAAETIRQLPRPRRIRVKPIPFFVTVVIGGLCGGFWIYTFIHLSVNGFDAHATLFTKALFTIWMVGVPLMLASFARDLIIHKKLLAEGEVTVGRIIEMRLVGRHHRHRIQYSFVDRMGRSFTGKSEDYSRELSEGSGAVVIYDPTNPAKRSVPLCGTLWKIALHESAAKT
jgi:hypothetical protein